ncbi:MAG: M16 family metallopeptidase [Myxococcota bacterium]
MIDDRDILLVEDHVRPIATFQLTLRTGLLDDPPGKEGLAYLTGEMLLRGAGDLSQERITEELDYLGATLHVATGRDVTSVTGDALVRNLDAFEDLVSTVLLEPTFPQEELDKLKRQTLAQLQQIRDHDPILGQHFFVRRLFHDHPYGRPLRGTEGSITRITREDVVDFYRRRYRSADVLVGAAGDVERDRVRAFAEATAGRLPDEPAPQVDVPAVEGPDGYRVTLVDKPGRSQTQIFVGHPTLHATHEDYVPLQMGNVVFGGTFTSRLSQEIREKRGWSYGAYSFLHVDRNLGTCLLRFYPSKKDAVPALKVADDLFRSLARDGVTDEELEAARSYVVHSHPMRVETAEKELHERLSARLLERPIDWHERFVERVRDVTRDEVNAALRRHLTPDRVVTCVVCTADDLHPDLVAWDRVDSVEVADYRER